MKPIIHPEYFEKATIRCRSCGVRYQVGATFKAAEVEVCAACHPFFSGKGSYVDTAKRIDRFRKRQAMARRSV